MFPLFWSSAGDWALLPLAWNGDDHNGFGPIWWGNDYFHLAPLYWSWNGNRLLLPLAWNLHGNKGVGPVWWGQNHFHVAPLFWSWNEDWLLFPLAWNLDGHKGVGPVFWGKDSRGESYLNVFPLWIRHDRTTWIPPLLGWMNRPAEGGVDFKLGLRLLRWAKDAQGYTFELQPLLDVSGGDVRHFSLVWRLFEYHRDADERYWRALFLPHKFKLKSKPAASPPPAGAIADSYLPPR